MSNSSTSAAATSSCVESGFEAQSTTSAPPAFSVRIRLAVSRRDVQARGDAVAARAAARARSARGSPPAPASAGRPTRSGRTPSGASARSLTSCRFVVAIVAPSVCRFRRRAAARACAAPIRAAARFGCRRATCRPRRAASGSRRRRAAKASSSELDAEAPPQLRERAQLVQLAQAVERGSRTRCAAGRRAPARSR